MGGTAFDMGGILAAWLDIAAASPPFFGVVPASLPSATQELSSMRLSGFPVPRLIAVSFCVLEALKRG